MEQPDFFQSNESIKPEPVKNKPASEAEIVDTGAFIKQEDTSTEEIIYCGECGTPRPKSERKCPGCGMYGK